MSPLTKIITTSLTCGLISSVAAVVSVILMGRIFFDNLNIIFPGGGGYSRSETIISLVCLVCLPASLVLCPLSAYFIRRSIFEFTSDALLRILLFVVVGSSQFIFLAVEYFTVFPYVIKGYRKAAAPPTLEETRRVRTAQVAKQLKAANVEVSVKRAKIIYDDGTNVIAELTLQIRNVPPEADDYLLEFRHFEKGENFVIGTRNLFNRRVKFGTIEAVNEGGRWAFYGQPGRELVSNNSDEVTLQINFFKSVPDNPALPQSVTPLLRTILRDEEGAYAQFEIFNRPVPVSFENP